jgi:hypothetical protein
MTPKGRPWLKLKKKKGGSCEPPFPFVQALSGTTLVSRVLPCPRYRMPIARCVDGVATGAVFV